MSSLIRFHYGPFTEFERLFGDSFGTRVCLYPSTVTDATQVPGSFRPRMDLKESEDANTVTATFELPGLKHEDIAVNLQQNCLTVSSECTTSSPSKEQEGHPIRERRYGKFSRTLQLPSGTKPEDVKAKLENGLLTVIFPKTSPEQRPQRIAIQ